MTSPAFKIKRSFTESVRDFLIVRNLVEEIKKTPDHLEELNQKVSKVLLSIKTYNKEISEVKELIGKLILIKKSESQVAYEDISKRIDLIMNSLVQTVWKRCEQESQYGQIEVAQLLFLLGEGSDQIDKLVEKIAQDDLLLEELGSLITNEDQFFKVIEIAVSSIEERSKQQGVWVYSSGYFRVSKTVNQWVKTHGKLSEGNQSKLFSIALESVSKSPKALLFWIELFKSEKEIFELVATNVKQLDSSKELEPLIEYLKSNPDLCSKGCLRALAKVAIERVGGLNDWLFVLGTEEDMLEILEKWEIRERFKKEEMAKIIDWFQESGEIKNKSHLFNIALNTMDVSGSLFRDWLRVFNHEEEFFKLAEVAVEGIPTEEVATIIVEWAQIHFEKNKERYRNLIRKFINHKGFYYPKDSRINDRVSILSKLVKIDGLFTEELFFLLLNRLVKLGDHEKNYEQSLTNLLAFTVTNPIKDIKALQDFAFLSLNMRRPSPAATWHPGERRLMQETLAEFQFWARYVNNDQFVDLAELLLTKVFSGLSIRQIVSCLKERHPIFETQKKLHPLIKKTLNGDSTLLSDWLDGAEVIDNHLLLEQAKIIFNRGEERPFRSLEFVAHHIPLELRIELFLMIWVRYPEMAKTNFLTGKKSIVEFTNRGLNFLEHPENGFNQLQLDPKDPFVMLEKEVESVPEEDRKFLLEWLGYFAFKLQLAGIKQNSPLVQDIFDLQNPPLRYRLTDFLFKYVYGISEKESKRDHSFVEIFKGEHTALFKLLFIPLQASGVDCSKAALMLSRVEFKDSTLQHAVLNALISLIDLPEFTMEEKARMFNLVLTPTSLEKEGVVVAKPDGKGAKESGEILKLMTAIIAAGESEGLNILLEEKLLFGAIKSKLETILKTYFNRLIDVSNVEEFGKKYHAVFDASRQPSAILLYAGKLHRLHDIGVLETFKAFVIDLLEKRYPLKRYLEKGSRHLEIVFEGREDLKKIWMNGARASVEALAKESGESAAEKGVDIRKYLIDRVCPDDNHLKRSDYKYLNALLQNQKMEEMDPQAAIKKEMAEVAKKLAELKKAYKSKEELEKSKEFNELNVLRMQLKLQEKLMILSTLKQESHQQIAALEDCLGWVKLLPGLSVFKDDLEGLKALLAGQVGEKQPVKVKDLMVIDTDNWEDLFLCGTEVMGSCQSIHGDPNLNKCLMGYVMDGKIRMIAVKNAQGKVIARRIMRLLWDDTLKTPVLFQERLYQSTGVPQVALNALDKMFELRANEMGLPLVKTRENIGAGAGKPYPNPLQSFGSAVQYEYVDAGSGTTNGVYSIAPETTEVVVS